MTRDRRETHWIRRLMAGALACAAAALVPGAPARAADDAKEPTAEQVEFFEKKIRPVLVEKCYSCHSHEAEKLKGEYYLDSRDAMIKGGESGKPAIVPGEPDKSPLIAMIKRTDPDEAMPPKEKDALSEQQVKDFVEWVKQGVPDPRKEADKGKKAAAGADGKPSPNAKEHWAFKKPVEPEVPDVKNAGWVRSPVDAFVLAKLESKGMTPAPQADKRTLIRRAYFTLLGLPPAAEEVAAFEADASPDAFAKVVDGLLASPHYGERWGRHWLDVARYADTKGYVFEEERKYPYAYTYRDYVIRAFNEDLPYDQFLVQQIAADRLDLGDDKRPLAAMGFLTLGRRFLNNQADIIDDRIDVVTRGTMALTVQCARCHDHKYDPIPTEDYYSLYGVFASSVEPKDLPSIGGGPSTAASQAFDKELKAREAAAEAFLDAKSDEALKRLRSAKAVADYLMAGQFSGTPQKQAYTAGLDLNRRITARWREFLNNSNAGHEPIFTPWRAYAAIKPEEFAATASAVTEQLFAKREGAKPIHPLVTAAFAGKPPANMREVADRFGLLLAAHSQEQSHPESEKEALRLVLHGPHSPLHAEAPARWQFLERDVQAQYNALRRKVDELRANDPGAPPSAMVLNDKPDPADTPVFKRGNAGMPGAVVPRRFLECVSTGERKPFRDGSGRLELARAIASADNPLTARVMVNRVWLAQFGGGLVRTPSDFGVRTERPTHPELLDWLALRFVETGPVLSERGESKGWSVKKLQRLIMLSATWQQASDHAEGATYATTDPDNTMLWRQNRRRMDFEAMRDSFLAVADTLDETAGGRPVDILDGAASRRTVYGFIDRQNLPGLFRTFDFASPDQHSPTRFFTTVPQQALFMLNSPFVERASRQVAAREELADESDTTRRIDRLYRTLFGRVPSAEEVAAGIAFVLDEQKRSPATEPTPWRYGYGRYDAAGDRVVEFKPLTRFAGGLWKASEAEVKAEPKLKWVGVAAATGHPGADSARAAIRRWVAPADGTLSIAGTASHTQDKSDGVLARVVSSRLGQLSSWTLHKMEAATTLGGIPVRKGDVIDFVVEPRANEQSDSFAWAPALRLTSAGAAVAGGEGVTEFDAQRDFVGTSAAPLNPWEKYAQVLLLSNEFAFVD